MLVVILIYDQLLFRPLVSWAERFRIDQEPGDEEKRSACGDEVPVHVHDRVHGKGGSRECKRGDGRPLGAGRSSPRGHDPGEELESSFVEWNAHLDETGRIVPEIDRI